MPHKPFHLIKRPTTKSGKFIYYVKFYDDYGKTGERKKTFLGNYIEEKDRPKKNK